MINPSFISKPIALALASTLLLACGDDTTTTDEVGDTSESADTGTTADGEESSESESAESSEAETGETESTETDSTETDSTDTDSTDTDSTDTGDPMCSSSDLEDIELSFGLIGSMSPPGSCNDFVFTGQLEGGGGGNWNLDACPCGAQCLVPDPYTLSISVPDQSLQPNMPMCPEIRIDRDPDTCEIVSVVIANIANNPGKTVWIASNQLPAPASVAELEVDAELLGACECPGDCEPPSLYRLVFDWLGDAIELIEGESAVLPVADGDWTISAINSHVYADQVEWYGWVMKR